MRSGQYAELAHCSALSAALGIAIYMHCPSGLQYSNGSVHPYTLTVHGRGVANDSEIAARVMWSSLHFNGDVNSLNLNHVVLLQQRNEATNSFESCEGSAPEYMPDLNVEPENPDSVADDSTSSHAAPSTMNDSETTPNLTEPRSTKRKHKRHSASNDPTARPTDRPDVESSVDTSVRSEVNAVFCVLVPRCIV